MSRRPLSEILYRPRTGTKRDIQLTASAERSERDFIDLAARAARRSRSAFLMDSALTFAHAYLGDQRPDDIPALPSPQALQDLTLLSGQLLREIHRVGVNLNQIARAVNTGTWPDRTDDVLAEVHALARATRLALEHVITGCRGGPAWCLTSPPAPAHAACCPTCSAPAGATSTPTLTSSPPSPCPASPTLAAHPWTSTTPS